MLIQESHKDVPTKADGEGTMRTAKAHPRTDSPILILREPGIFLFHPTIAGYPHAKFPGVVVFSEIYQGM
jgi:carboxymethylenebutenolidase